jgi:regulator of cell morphogenesis and NO signaling
MTINATKTVRELAVEVPGATRVFEKIGIDYCCGGGKTIEEACAAAGVSVEEIARSLQQQAHPGALDAETDWQSEPLSKLTSYIVSKHHLFTRDELERLDHLIAKVVSVHGQNHRELLGIQESFQELKRDLIPHMHKEEMILFPFVEQMDAAVRSGQPAPFPFFGTVQNPVRMMMLEHDAAGEILKRIRQLSGGFAAPGDACISYETLYKALEAFESDLHLHIHLENNILFPRAVDLEAANR